MITGFNTDIQFDGTTYHVQTEDKGLDSPLILSLVYVGGAIIASKRTPYRDLIETGFEEQALTERLQRQHKLICAAIRAGRIEDLKRMGERDGNGRHTSKVRDEEAKAEEAEEVRAEVAGAPDGPVADAATREADFAAAQIIIEPAGEAPDSHPEEAEPPTLIFVVAPLPDAGAKGTVEKPPPLPEPAHPEEPEQLFLGLRDDEADFRAGQLATLNIQIGRGRDGRVPVAGADVSVKILGTTFRPLVLATKTDGEGNAVINALLPRFTSGRAAVIIRAVDGDDVSELRRIIHQS